MKKTALLLLSLFIGAQYSSACDICGCGTLYTPGNSAYRASQNSISLFWDHTDFRSEHLPSILKGQEGISEQSSETFNRLRLMGQWRIYKQLQVSASVPYQLTNKQGSAQDQISGLGDISLGLSYPLWSDSIGSFAQLLKLNVQTKMPNGRYQPELISESISRYMFTGTGSWDHSINLSWAWMKKNWSFAWQGYFALNGIAKDGLDWGDAMGQSVELWYFKTKNKLKYGFSAGMSQDYRYQDRLQGQPLQYSGYSLYSIVPAAAAVWDRWVLEGRIWMPLAQDIAQGQVHMNQRFQLKLQCLFP
ncbi:MAG: hypothetical protein EP332_08940 [Bacteroidetes bacterium]|nr:MAG: hypothetical protein EP332_08940 [Bacteroidota bacterium]